MLKNIRKHTNVLFIRKYTENSEINNIKKLSVTMEQLNKGFIIEKKEFMNDEKIMVEIKKESNISVIISMIFGILLLCLAPGICVQLMKLNKRIADL